MSSDKAPGPRVNSDEIEYHADGFAAHHGEAFTGQIIDYDTDGNLIELSSYVNGFPDGIEREWYSDGTLRLAGTMRDGMPVGVHHRWHPGGALAEEAHFDDHGTLVHRQSWDASGNQL